MVNGPVPGQGAPVTRSLMSLIDMSKYTALLNGLGNPALTLLAFAPAGECVWHSGRVPLDDEVLQVIGLEIAPQDRGTAVTQHATPLARHSQHNEFNLTVLPVEEENAANLVALVMVEYVPARPSSPVGRPVMHAEQAGILVVAIRNLLLTELDHVARELQPNSVASTSSDEIGLLSAVSQLLPTYINGHKSRHAAAHEPGQTEAVLRAILAECTARLSIDSAVLYLRSDNLLLSAAKKNLGDVARAGLLRMARKDTLQFESSATRVILKRAGEASTPNAQGALTDFVSGHDRLMVCIPDSLGRVAGVLVFLRKPSAQGAFTQTEHAVIELLVQPVLKIINADYDAVTGFLNTDGFYPKLAAMLAMPEADTYESCLLQIRFAQLISIGDSCGSEALDEAIVQLGAILSKRIRKRDLVARTGSSDFLLYLNKCSSKDAEALSEALLDTLKGFRFSFKEQLFNINAFIGVVPVARTDREIRSLLDAADAACTDAMNLGVNGYSMYEPRRQVAVRNNGLIVWSDRIIETLRDNKLHLYSQPVARAHSLDQVDHHEVLLRIRSDNSLVVAPSVFVRVAERSRLVDQVDHWVIRNAFGKLNEIYAASPTASTALSINVSGMTLNEQFPAYINELMEDMKFPRSAIIFEITEASAVSNMKFVVKAVKALRRDGFRFSLDDFGAGMGSFAFLQNLAVDRLKIDGALVRGITRSDVNYAIVEALQLVSHSMNLQTTAKMVDDEALLESLKRIGVDFIQGHLVARAAPISQLTSELSVSGPGVRKGSA